jgi:DNA mismatch endonuclease (patch repair protein)
MNVRTHRGPSRTSRQRIKPRTKAVQLFMQRLRARDTTPEQKMRSALHRQGLRFRKHYRALPGSPDIVFSTARVAVFVDGCFWHLCPRHAVYPKHNAHWWKAKLLQNAERDRRNDRLLRLMRWRPVRVWEHENVEEAARRIEKLVRQRTAARSSGMAKQARGLKTRVKRR